MSADTPQRFRLFVAIPVPDEVRKQMAKAQAELRDLLPAKMVRWTAPEQFHLTLRFLGEVEAQKINDLEASLQTAIKGFAPFDLRARGIGFFPDARQPRVIWVGLEEISGTLPALWQAIQTATQAFAEAESEGKFIGHLTLGRIKFIRPRERAILQEHASALKTTGLGEWQAREVHLMRSYLSSEGARHEVVKILGL